MYILAAKHVRGGPVVIGCLRGTIIAVIAVAKQCLSYGSTYVNFEAVHVYILRLEERLNLHTHDRLYMTHLQFIIYATSAKHAKVTRNFCFGKKLI